MNTPITIFLASIVAASAAVAQNQNGLLYSTLVDEQSNQCASTPGLDRVRSSSLEYVEPVPHPVFGIYPYTGKAYMPTLGYNTVAGDVDCDAQYFEPNMFGRIDAVMHPRDLAGNRIPLDKTRVFFSGAANFSDLAGTQFRRGDVARLLPQLGSFGVVEHFLHDFDIRAAFNISPNYQIEVDAVALGQSIPGVVGMDIFLSFENTVLIDVAPWGPTFIRDGAIVCIPGFAVGLWNVAADGAALVAAGSVVPGSGVIVAREPDVDLWVANSGISDETGAPIVQIGDVDGLTLDPAGGWLQTNWSPFPVPHLIFSGDDPTLLGPGIGLSGGGMVSTQSAGSIAMVNWVPMGKWAPLPTLGDHVGLVTLPRVGSLAGLALTRPNTSHFSMDSATERMLAPGIMSLEVGGGNPSGPPGIILLDLGAIGPCGFDPAMFPAPPNPDFPMIYPTKVLGSVTFGADGCATLPLPIFPALYGFLSGLALEFQSFQGAIAGTPLHVSNPIRVEFY